MKMRYIVNRRADSLLNRIELSFQAIDNPRHCRNDIFGQGRTILPNIKIQELGMLLEKLKELENVISSDDKGRLESYEGIKSRIEEEINNIFNPQILIEQKKMV